MRTYRGVHVVALGIVGEVTAFKEEDIHRLFDELYNAGQFNDLRLYNNPKTRTAGTGKCGDKLYPCDQQGRVNDRHLDPPFIG